MNYAPRSLSDHFNSHAHVERDLAHQYLHYNSYISTHTLTWSVTEILKLDRISTFISTHTLTWSVTNRFKIINRIRNNFNSHAHVERDRHNKKLQANIFQISTHTLTWSVTHYKKIT